ncbi:glucose-6-phosphate isomerase [Candidatus Pelagibacter sp.]|nr:glucose-6-phosphate isomerase [Candidatus Pelagibacter sp.]
MFFKSIKIKNFFFNDNLKSFKRLSISLYKKLINSNNHILLSMMNDYQNSYSKKLILDLKKYKIVNIIGMGGSSLGSRAIYNFLNSKKKKFNFIDNFSNMNLKSNKEKKVNIIISKSGNTLETIANSNININQNKNIFLTENKKSYLTEIANKLKAEVVNHNNYIGGRYSVLSEVGMLPAELMGYKPEKFRRLNKLIKNKKFVNLLIQNVSNILFLTKKNKTNSIILNYDDRAEDLFKWYQQLVAESLGKNNKGLLPVISSMPKDNHSVMQFYLDGTKNGFYTLFFAKENLSQRIKSANLLSSYSYIKNKTINDIAFAQFLATEKVFKRKNIPFRSIVINKRNEETLGELFTFFILETILLGMAIKVNPYDQPAVELIKIETKKLLNKN